MLCAKHNNDITNKNKEQFGDIWLCRFAIWDSQIVTDLFLKQDVQNEYQTRKANPPTKIQTLRDFMATNPTDAEVIEFMKTY